MNVFIDIILKQVLILYLVDPEVESTALRKLIQSVPLSLSLNKEELFNALLSREEMMSTAIGNGIAIPHVRLFDSMSLQEDIVVVAYLFEPVDWVAPDEKPVHTLFFCACCRRDKAFADSCGDSSACFRRRFCGFLENNASERVSDRENSATRR